MPQRNPSIAPLLTKNSGASPLNLINSPTNTVGEKENRTPPINQKRKKENANPSLILPFPTPLTLMAMQCRGNGGQIGFLKATNGEGNANGAGFRDQQKGIMGLSPKEVYKL